MRAMSHFIVLDIKKGEFWMRFTLTIITIFSILYSKELYLPYQPNRTESVLFYNDGIQQSRNTLTSRDDTITIFFEDFEGDVTNWTADPEWGLTEEDSYSPFYSYNIDDNNNGATSSLLSPIITIPEIEIDENSGITFSFMLNCDLPDYNGDNDDYLDDYYFMDIADLGATPWHISDYMLIQKIPGGVEVKK